LAVKLRTDDRRLTTDDRYDRYDRRPTTDDG
jgi:hypothetical protein